MVPIARLLSDEQITDISAYFANLPSERERGPTP
jgi:cytochrome c553